jgi:hypothetical protein
MAVPVELVTVPEIVPADCTRLKFTVVVFAVVTATPDCVELW